MQSKITNHRLVKYYKVRQQNVDWVELKKWTYLRDPVTMRCPIADVYTICGAPVCATIQYSRLFTDKHKSMALEYGVMITT